MNLWVVVGVTFLAAAVEWVEALTIVLAVGLFKGWRSVFLGTVLAVIALVALVLIFGVGLGAIIPIATARALVGVFLLLFGLKWLHKAILRSSGLKALHNEAQVFEKQSKALSSGGQVSKNRIDGVGTLTAFNGVFLEGLEVVFIVIALGVSDMGAAALGALASFVVVVTAGAIFRAPLTTVPENTMKYVVGIMLTTFGTFFAGEGIGVKWWNSDASILWLIAVYAIGSVILVQILKRPPSQIPHAPSGAGRAIRGVASELWGLFVGDSALALVVIVALLAVALYATLEGHRQISSILLVVGVIISVIVGTVEPYRQKASELRSASRPSGPAKVAVTVGSSLPSEAPTAGSAVE